MHALKDARLYYKPAAGQIYVRSACMQVGAHTETYRGRAGRQASRQAGSYLKTYWSSVHRVALCLQHPLEVPHHRQSPALR